MKPLEMKELDLGIDYVKEEMPETDLQLKPNTVGSFQNFSL